MPTAIIFRERLLAPSETFIFEQAQALRRYQPVLTGLRRASKTLDHTLPEILLSDGSGIMDKVVANLHQFIPLGLSFRKRLKSLRPSILHAHFGLDAVRAMPLAKSLGLPMVVSLHGFDVTSSEDTLRRTVSGRQYLLYRRRMFDYTSVFLCVSAAVREAAVRAGYPVGKLVVHHTGIDCDRFRPATFERDPNLILFVGRLVEKKGCEYLIRAMAAVQQEHPAAHLEIIGDGPLRAELESLAKSMNVPAVFRGVQQPTEVQRSMSRAWILCNPSVTAKSGDMEGFGMVFAEAQAVGTPIVSTLHGGIPEAVSDGETGLLCPEREPEPLAKALLVLLKSRTFWQYANQRAIDWVNSRFDISRQTSRLENIYDAVASRQVSPAIPFKDAAVLLDDCAKGLHFPQSC